MAMQIPDGICLDRDCQMIRRYRYLYIREIRRDSFIRSSFLIHDCDSFSFSFR